MEVSEIKSLLRVMYGGSGQAQSPYDLYRVLIDGGYLKPGDPLPTYSDSQRLLANPEDVNDIKPAKERLAAEGLVTYTTGDRAYVAGAPPKLTRGDKGFGKTKEDPKAEYISHQEAHRLSGELIDALMVATKSAKSAKDKLDKDSPAYMDVLTVWYSAVAAYHAAHVIHDGTGE